MNEVVRQNRVFSAVYDVWDKLRKPGELVPTRDRFNPMALSEALPEVVLVERVARGRYEYRLLGTAINERLGDNPVGVNMLDYFAPKVRAFVTDWFEAIAFHPCGAATRADMEFENDPDRFVHAFGLPLLGKGGEGQFYLYCHDAWRPQPGDNLGHIVSVGGSYIETEAVDIGAGRPLLPNMPGSGPKP